MRTRLAKLLTLLLAWWVVYGYGYPPRIVAGPYYDWWECQRMANFLNRTYLDYNYRCEWLYY